jgi:hypothetical protein
MALRHLVVVPFPFDLFDITRFECHKALTAKLAVGKITVVIGSAIPPNFEFAVHGLVLKVANVFGIALSVRALSPLPIDKGAVEPTFSVLLIEIFHLAFNHLVLIEFSNKFGFSIGIGQGSDLSVTFLIFDWAYIKGSVGIVDSRSFFRHAALLLIRFSFSFYYKRI